MNITKLVEQLLEQLDELRGQVFIRALQELGDEVDSDQVLIAFEEVQSLGEEELSADTYKKFEAANQSGSKISETDPKHKKFNNDVKSEQEGSHLTDNLGGALPDSKSEKLADFAARLNAKAREHVKDSQAIKEGEDDLEPIDELKASTLGNYIKSAAVDAAMNAAESEAIKAKDKYSQLQGTVKKKVGKTWQRVKGIYTATDKLSKGDFQESFDFLEDVAAIFEGQDFSPEFIETATVILEASIKAKAKNVIEMYEDAVLESVSEMIQDEIDSLQESLENQLSKYLDHIVSEYLNENELAIESGLRVEIAESIMDGIKGVLAENSIQVSDEKVDLFEEAISERDTILQEAVVAKQETEELYQREVNAVIALKEEIIDLKKQLISEELTADLTDLQKVRVQRIFEELDADDLEDWSEKAQLVVETYTRKGFTRPSKQLINEDLDDFKSTEKIELAPEVTAALGALDRYTIKTNN